MRCALVRNETGLVENIILANPETDTPPVGYEIVAIEDGTPVGFGWIWDGSTFINPNPEPTN